MWRGEDTGDMTATSLVFSYGSNLDGTRMKGRVPSARFVGRSVLDGHVLRFHKRGWKDGTGKANAHATGDAGDAVHGVIWEVDTEHLVDLDRHESGYERELRRFASTVDGERVYVEAWIYLATPEAIDESLLPKRWYLDHVIRGARAHGFPKALLAQLREQPTLD